MDNLKYKHWQINTLVFKFAGITLTEYRLKEKNMKQK